MISVVCLYPDRAPEEKAVSPTGGYVARTLGPGAAPTFLGSADNGGDTGVFLMGDHNQQGEGGGGGLPPIPPASIPPPFRTDAGPLRGMLIITKLRYHSDEATLPTPVDYTMEDYRRQMSARCSN